MIKGIIFDFGRTLYDPDARMLLPGAIPLLSRLHKSYRLCLITKAPAGAEEREAEIRKLGLRWFFVKVVVAGEDKSEAHFRECQEAMRLLPEEILVVGDRIKREIVIGNRLGMKTCWFRNGKFKDEVPEAKEEEPSYTILDLSDLVVE